MSQIDPSNPYSELNSKEGVVYKVYKYRWVIVFCYAITSFQNMMVWTVFTPVQSTMAKVYDLSDSTVNFGTTVIQNFMAIPGTLLCNYIFDYKGIKFGIYLGSIMTAVGLWIRIFCNQGFAYIVMGQVLGGIAQPMFVNTSQTISSIWFAEKERFWTTSLMNVFLTVGSGIGGLVPGYFIGETKKQTQAETMSQVTSMMYWMAIIGTVTIIPALLLTKDKPPTPPCAAVEIKRYDFWKSLKMLFVNKNCLLFIIASSFVYGTMLTSSYINELQFKPFHVDEKEAGAIFALSYFISPPCYFIGALLLRWFKTYKKSLLFLFALWTFSVLAMIPISYTENTYLIGSFYIYITALSCPPIALCLEYVVEVSYPVGETAAGGMYTLISQQFSSLTAWICDKILNDGTQASAVWSYIVLAIVSAGGIIVMFFVKEDLRRTNYKKEEAEGETTKAPHNDTLTEPLNNS